MKQFYFVAWLLIMHSQTFSQLNNGGLNASFGVDADTKAGYLKYGPVTGTVSSDDWFSTINGRLWLDALYARDYIVTATATDSTAFIGGKKNGDDPATWGGAASSVPDKTDLVDACAHMRP